MLAKEDLLVPTDFRRVGSILEESEQRKGITFMVAGYVMRTPVHLAKRLIDRFKELEKERRLFAWGMKSWNIKSFVNVYIKYPWTMGFL